MEESLYTQKSVISDLNRRISSIEIKDVKEFKEKEATASPYVGLVLSAIGVLWLFLVFGSGIVKSDVGILFNCFLAAPFILGGIIITINESSEDKSIKSRNNAEKKRIEEENKIIIAERPIKEAQKAALGLARDKIVEQKKSTEANLKEMYSANVIYPKYRDFAMVSSIYEYIDSGRCLELEGHEGAYNILETEIRLDRIESKLDVIIRRLDDIMSNQRTLYNALIQSRDTTNRLISSVEEMADRIAFQSQRIDEMNKNTELAAYSAERARKELNYMNWMKHLNGDYKYSDIFNLPK